MIVLALVAGLGVGLAVGMLIGGGDDSGQAATTTGRHPTAGPTTTAAWEPSDAYGAAVRRHRQCPARAAAATAADTAVGLPMPQIAGTDFAGNPLAINADGRAKLIVALAHWCPYCNDEVPILNDWYAAGVPEGVDVIALHVYADPAKPHFPPAAWVEEVALHPAADRRRREPHPRQDARDPGSALLAARLRRRHRHGTGHGPGGSRRPRRHRRGPGRHRHRRPDRAATLAPPEEARCATICRPGRAASW